MGRDLRLGCRLAAPAFDQFELLLELLVAQHRLIQPPRLLVKHITQFLYRPLHMRTFEFQRLKARPIIHSPAPCLPTVTPNGDRIRIVTQQNRPEY